MPKLKVQTSQGRIYKQEHIELKLADRSRQTLHRPARRLADLETFPPAAKVLQSMTAHWAGLTVFVASPWVKIDNYAAERSMRIPVVGRKNFNGSGSVGSAELAATMYSLFATMKLWGLNLRTWLTLPICRPAPIMAMRRPHPADRGTRFTGAQ
ncbi:transposase [Rhodoferax sp.]|uniref:IS66 family transposase n=1 Tax=Rhodoferax sp. TaxID=50421 RepID=UPI0026258C89|nr:transposase [Rhodoferax sp.]MDD4941943.1 transposase [Rhodoferax sp.]MDD5480022.1 transposase [Rhodoferax sp.]